jgi:hypothetical protein
MEFKCSSITTNKIVIIIATAYMLHVFLNHVIINACYKNYTAFQNIGKLLGMTVYFSWFPQVIPGTCQDNA